MQRKSACSLLSSYCLSSQWCSASPWSCPVCRPLRSRQRASQGWLWLQRSQLCGHYSPLLSPPGYASTWPRFLLCEQAQSYNIWQSMKYFGCVQPEESRAAKVKSQAAGIILPRLSLCWFRGHLCPCVYILRLSNDRKKKSIYMWLRFPSVQNAP